MPAEGIQPETAEKTRTVLDKHFSREVQLSVYPATEYLEQAPDTVGSGEICDLEHIAGYIEVQAGLSEDQLRKIGHQFASQLPKKGFRARFDKRVCGPCWDRSRSPEPGP